jgi:hypothetical protein
MDATHAIQHQQETMRGIVGKDLEPYRPKRGTYGKRAQVFWGRFTLPGPQ